MTRRRGRDSSARPIATRCFSPPDRPPVRAPAGCYAEQLDDVLDLAGPAGTRCEPAPVKQVLPHGQVRKKAAFLEHVADVALVRRDEQAAFGIGQDIAIDDDPAVLGPAQPGDRVDERGLACAGTAEQRGQPARALEFRVEHEFAEPMADGDAEHQTPAARRVACCATASEANSAAIEIAIDTSVSRNARDIAAGDCVSA
jgi:hypothetical protein